MRKIVQHTQNTAEMWKKTMYKKELDKNRKWVHNLPQSRKKHSCKTERVNNDVSEAN